MDAPSATEIRTWGPPGFDWTKYGYPDPGGDTALAVRGEWAAGTLYAVTGRTLDSITTVEEVSIAQKILTAFVITEAMGGGPAALAVLEKPWLKSFTAGSYSETRFSPSELSASGKLPYALPLWMLLWALMTDEKKDEWIEVLGGTRRPAGTYIGVDFEGPFAEDELGPGVYGNSITNEW